MRIAVLAHALRAAGGESVGVNLLTAFARLGTADEFFVLAPDTNAYRKAEWPLNFEVTHYKQKLGGLGRVWHDALHLRRWMSKIRPDVLLAMGNMGLADPGSPQAILFHKPQLIYPRLHWDRENLYGKLRNRLIAAQLARSLRHTQLVICQTEVAASRFRHTFAYEGKIAISPNAVSVEIDADQATDDSFQLPPATNGKFVLFAFTRYYPHKNLEAIVECFRRFRTELKDVVVILTIEPTDHPGARRLLETIRLNGLDESIVNIGRVPQRLARRYYSAAQALLLPTLIESFTATYVEAMTFGTPILTSDMDFARELCGEAALYFDPLSPSSMLGAISKLRDDPVASVSLIEKGRIQRTCFGRSWEDIGAAVIHELTELVRAPRSGPQASD